MLLQLIKIKREGAGLSTEIKETINFEEGSPALRIVDEFEGGNLYYLLGKSDFQKICEAKRKERREYCANMGKEAQEKRRESETKSKKEDSI